MSPKLGDEDAVDGTSSWMSIKLLRVRNLAGRIKLTMAAAGRLLSDSGWSWTFRTQCIQLFFSQALFDFKKSVSHSISPKERLFVPSSNPEFVFWGSKKKKKQSCLNKFKGSVEWSRHEQHFCSLLPYFLLSWLQIFQLCLSFWTSSFDLVLL